MALAAIVWTDRSETILTSLGLCIAAWMHAIGHAIAANVRGEGVESMTLYPFWSTTRLLRAPAEIDDDLMISVAGPLLNALVGAAMLMAFDGPLGREPEWLGQWSRIQIGMGAASLLPIFPLDGARLLRLGLKWRYSERQAWEMAAFVSQAAAGGLVLWGLFQGYYSIAAAGIVFYLIGRFSTLLLEIGKRLNEAEREGLQGWDKSRVDDGETITLTQTPDGVWQHLEPSPSNESRLYF